MPLQRPATPQGVVAITPKGTAAASPTQHRKATASTIASPNGQATAFSSDSRIATGQVIGDDRQAEVCDEFQQQVCVRLQVIERKLDSLIIRLPSPSETQPPRYDRISTRSKSQEPKRLSFDGLLPGVPGNGANSEERLEPPMSPPPPEPLAGAWTDDRKIANRRNSDESTFCSGLDETRASSLHHQRTRPSLFKHKSSSRIKLATKMVTSPYMHALQRLDEGLGLNQIRSQRAAATKRYSQTKIWRLVHSVPFQVTISLIIVVNALFIGLATDAELSAFMRQEEPGRIWAHADVVFCVIFFMELFLRALCERGLFFWGDEWMWNLFDTALVALSIVDAVLNNAGGGMANIGAARIFRFVRFVRLIRLARAVRAIHSLRLFILSIFASGISLLWCALIVSIIVYFFAVCFLNGVTEYFRDGDNNPQDETMVVEMYGNVWLAMVTLFMCISGGIDWKDAMEPLVNVHWAYEPTFVYFIFFMFFGVLNIVVGAFVTATTEISKKDRELLVSAELEAVEAYTKKIREFFAEADKDKSGMLSWEEFQEHLQNPKVSAYFASLELDVSNAHRLFRLLDIDGSNEVGLDEFLDGCMRLKGQARSIDVNMLVYEIERMSRQVSHIINASQDGKLWVADGSSGDGSRQVEPW